MSTAELVDRFVVLCVSQGEAIFEGSVAKANRLYDQIEAIEDALRGRAGDQRGALLPLLSHPSAQVRLKAALATFTADPIAARRALQFIVDHNERPQCIDAGMRLSRLDGGSYKPD